MEAKKPKIAHVATSISLWMFLRTQAAELGRLGYEQVFYCGRDAWGSRLEMLGFDVADIGFRRGISLLHDLITTVRLFLALRRHRVDIVHTHNSKPGVLGRIAARLAGVPVVIHTHHSLSFYAGQNPVVFGGIVAIEKLTGRFTDAVMFQNSDDMEMNRMHRVLPESKMVFIGNGIDVEGVLKKAEGAGRDEVRSGLGIGAGETAIICIARLEPVKGHEMLLEAFARLCRQRNDARLLLVGAGVLLGKCRQLAMDSGIGERVSFLGWREDVPSLIAASDISVLTSKKEGIPRALMESMLLGIPVIATNVPGNRELVADRECGLLVPYGDHARLHEAILTLMDNADLRARLSDAGRERVLAEFDERMVVGRVAQEYDRLLAMKRPAWK